MEEKKEQRKSTIQISRPWNLIQLLSVGCRWLPSHGFPSPIKLRNLSLASKTSMWPVVSPYYPQPFTLSLTTLPLPQSTPLKICQAGPTPGLCSCCRLSLTLPCVFLMAPSLPSLLDSPPYQRSPPWPTTLPKRTCSCPSLSPFRVLSSQRTTLYILLSDLSPHEHVNLWEQQMAKVLDSARGRMQVFLRERTFIIPSECSVVVFLKHMDMRSINKIEFFSESD